MTIAIIIFFYVAPLILVIKVFNFFVLILMILIWILNTIFLYYFTDWWGEVGVKTPKITYRQFINLYNVMPDNFTLRNYNIYYKNMLTDFKTFLDYLRYHYFYTNIQTYKIKQEQLQNQAMLIKELRRGLAEQQNEIDEFVKEEVIKCVKTDADF